MSFLTISNVKKEYTTATGKVPVLCDVNLSATRGESVAIVGPSGSGKSTLLAIIGTLEQPTEGQVLIDGENPFSLDETSLSKFRNENIGFVFQEHFLLPQCTVLENTVLPIMATGKVTVKDQQHAMELLDQVGLVHRLQHRPAELSGGERQRVAIARALICRPALLLADEPTGNLDSKTASSVFDLLLTVQSELNMLLMVVTHNEQLAGRLQKQLTLSDGSVVQR